MSSDTSLSYNTTSADCISCTARSVSSPGSPGPVPTRYTQPGPAVGAAPARRLQGSVVKGALWGVRGAAWRVARTAAQAAAAERRRRALTALLALAQQRQEAAGVPLIVLLGLLGLLARGQAAGCVLLLLPPLWAPTELRARHARRADRRMGCLRTDRATQGADHGGGAAGSRAVWLLRSAAERFLRKLSLQHCAA